MSLKNIFKRTDASEELAELKTKINDLIKTVELHKNQFKYYDLWDYTAQKEIELARKDAMDVLKYQFCNSTNCNLSMRQLRPKDLHILSSNNNTYKILSDHSIFNIDTNNEFIFDIPHNCVYVIEGISLATPNGCYINNVNMFINDVKQRWYSGQKIYKRPNNLLLLTDTMVARSDESIKIEFTNNIPDENFYIEILGTVFKYHAK